MFTHSASALTIENIGPQIGLGDVDLLTAVLNLITIGLGLLGIVAMCMIILGGFRWLISAGDEEKIAAAKRTISSAIIGLVFILLSWAIVNYVIQTTGDVTGAL